MKKYLLNKNVLHNGISYQKGQEIRPCNVGFKEIVSQGHADELIFADDFDSKGLEDVKIEQETKPTQQFKSSKKSYK